MIKKIKEKILKGVSASPGISIGTPFYYVHEVLNVPERAISDLETVQEIEKYKNALKITRNNILKDQKIALKRGGTEAAKIFDTHLLIIDDEVLTNQGEDFIKKNMVCASYAVSKVMKDYQLVFENMQNEYFSQRAFDIEDVCRRIIRNIMFKEQGQQYTNILSGKKIIVSNNIFPSDTINFDPENVLGFITEFGGKTSHAALLSRSLEVPAVVGISTIFKDMKSTDLLILDGDKGIIIINPTTDTLRKYRRLERKQDKRLKEDIDISKQEPITQDDVKINLACNLHSEKELDNFLKWGQKSKGIGLLRTEFLFEEKVGILTEEEQFRIYNRISATTYPENTIIRLLDIGGDKLQSKIALQEDNPFLGLRGIRLLFEQKELLRSHLRAILRASHRKNIWIMVPFLSEIGEMRKIISIINKEKQILIEEGYKIDKNIKIGTMIEIPSAVLIADHLAKIVDFFSIGTNDLIQYTIAADRGNEKVAYIYDALHPSVLKLIKMTIEAADKAGIYVGLCGQMAGNPEMLPLLIGMGLRNLSVTPFMIPELIRVITKINNSDCQKLADKALKATTNKQVNKELQNFLKIIK